MKGYRLPIQHCEKNVRMVSDHQCKNLLGCSSIPKNGEKNTSTKKSGIGKWKWWNIALLSII